MASLLRFSPAVFALVVACGSGNDGMPNAKSAMMDPGAPLDPTATKEKPHVIAQLKRAEVKAAIDQGLGYFLQNVVVDDNAVMQDGKFHGFVLRQLNDSWIIDLKPGDVITRVNGIVPEQPDDADNAFRSLAKATALKVDYERNGQSRTLQIPIVD